MSDAYTMYFKDDIKILDDSLKSIDLQSFEELIDDCETALRGGHKIITSGLGKNVPICEKFEGTMLSLGLDSNFMHTNTAVHGDLGMVKKGDVVIILTKSGSTTESVYLAELLKKREGVVLWLLTFNQNGVLSKEMNKKIVVSLEREGDLWNIVPNHSTTLNLIILQKVAIELSKRLKLDLEKDFKPNHPGGAIGAKLNEK